MKIGFRDMIAAADAAVETVPAQQALKRHEDESVVFVDIRDVRELERDGMIPGAFHCPRGMLEFWAHPESPYHKPLFAQDKTFVLYCASSWRSALSTKALKDMGMENVAHIGGGFTAWKEAGGAVGEKPAKKPK
ncbi:MAG: rhodanese-like domain-containing protein [Pseudomonadota bacterium]